MATETKEKAFDFMNSTVKIGVVFGLLSSFGLVVRWTTNTSADVDVIKVSINNILANQTAWQIQQTTLSSEIQNIKTDNLLRDSKLSMSVADLQTKLEKIATEGSQITRERLAAIESELKLKKP